MATPEKYRGTTSRTGQVVVGVAAVADLALRAWALADLVTRPQEQVRGSKTGWAIALAAVNSVGLLPAAYLAWGRHAG